MATKKLTTEEVQKIANLASLELTADELVKFQGQLTDILDYIQMLDEVDTANVEPTAQTTGMINNFRVDEVAPSLAASKAVSQSEKTRGDYFQVKAVFTKE